MTDRPAILSAKVDKQSVVIADADELKQMPKSERPNSASLDAVRGAYSEAMREIEGSKTSVAAVEQIAEPTERLK